MIKAKIEKVNFHYSSFKDNLGQINIQANSHIDNKYSHRQQMVTQTANRHTDNKKSHRLQIVTQAVIHTTNIHINNK